MSKRGTIDLSSATPIDKAFIALSAIGIAVGLVLLGAAVAQANGSSRIARFVLIAAAVFYTLYNIFGVVSFVEPFNSENGQSNSFVRNVTNVSIARNVFGSWAISLPLVSAFLLLWHHAGWHYSRAQKVVEWFFLAQTLLWPIIQSAISGAIFNIILSGSFSPFGNLQGLTNAANGISYFQTALAGVLVLDFAVSSLQTRFSGAKSASMTLLTAAYLPLLLLEYGYLLFNVIFTAVHVLTSLEDNATIDVQLANLVVIVVIIAAEIGVLLVVNRDGTTHVPETASEVAIALKPHPPLNGDKRSAV